MKGYGLTDRGKVRLENQDCFIIERSNTADCFIFALCDGMGGANAGGIASKMTASAFVSQVYAKVSSRRLTRNNICNVLTDACRYSNSVAFEYSTFDDSLAGMGTTIVGGIVYDDGRCFIISAGDSRAYVINSRKAEIRQVTRDHSLVEELISSGIITREESISHPQKNVITKAVGTEPDIDPDYFHLRIGHSERLMICSDGLTNIISDPEIMKCSMHHSYDNESFCKELMSKALKRGARDNVSVVSFGR